MATGIIGLIAGAGEIVYKPQNNAKTVVNYQAGQNGGLTVNGVSQNLAAGLYWVGAGQTLTVKSSGGYVVVTALEG
ncbi:MAG: hypothetical protein ABW202_03750 [Duganella sp.]